MKKLIVLLALLVIIPVSAVAVNLPSYKPAISEVAYPTGYTLSPGETVLFGPVYVRQLDPKSIEGAVALELLAVSPSGNADIAVSVYTLSQLAPPLPATMWAPGNPPTNISIITTSTLTDMPSVAEEPFNIGIRLTPSSAYYLEITENTGTLADTVVSGGFWFK